MHAPDPPDHGFYASSYAGAATAEQFAAALPRALARLGALVPRDVPERHADAWRLAACAMVDRVAGLDTRGEVASETVGSTSVAYTAAAQSSTDYDAALPYLAGTGLLCRIVPMGGRGPC